MIFVGLPLKSVYITGHSFTSYTRAIVYTQACLVCTLKIVSFQMQLKVLVDPYILTGLGPVYENLILAYEPAQNSRYSVEALLLYPITLRS